MEFNFFETRKPGEYELLKSLRENGYEVRDVSQDPSYWDKDIDLIVTNLETKVITNIEVKWDNRISETR